MLLWVLCLQLWWLLLPSSTLGYPPLERALERRTLSTNPEPRDGPLISGPDDRNAADIVGRRDVVPPNGDDKLMLLDLQSPSVNYTSTPVLWQSNAPGPLNATHGEYGAYRGRGERIEFDFEYPPFTQKKIIVRLIPTLCCQEGSVCSLTKAN